MHPVEVVERVDIALRHNRVEAVENQSSLVKLSFHGFVVDIIRRGAEHIGGYGRLFALLQRCNHQIGNALVFVLAQKRELAAELFKRKAHNHAARAVVNHVFREV